MILNYKISGHVTDAPFLIYTIVTDGKGYMVVSLHIYDGSNDLLLYHYIIIIL